MIRKLKIITIKMETNKNNDIELIEQYIDGELTTDEKKDFNRRLESDSSFAKLYRFRLKIKTDLQKAEQYRQVSNKIADSVKRVKQKQHRKIGYAIAATVALLIAIPGFLTITKQQDNINIAKTDSTKTELLAPKIKQPKNYANTGKYVASNMILTTKIKNDSIIFSWQPPVEKRTVLIIRKPNDSEVFRQEIKQGTKQVTLKSSNLPKGKLIWHIDGYEIKDSFSIK